LSHLPPAHVVTAEYDVLRDEAEAYADRLRQAGVSVTQQRYLGTIHGFIGMAEILETGREAIAQVSDRLHRALHPGNG
jgi:acetyl esterase